MTPMFYLKKGSGWHEVNGVLDVRIAEGKFKLEDGTEMNGDLMAIVMTYNQKDSGQQALRKLLTMESRIIDGRIVANSRIDVSFILCGDETSKTHPGRYALLARVMGIRPTGMPVVDPSRLNGAEVC